MCKQWIAIHIYCLVDDNKHGDDDGDREKLLHFLPFISFITDLCLFFCKTSAMFSVPM